MTTREKIDFKGMGKFSTHWKNNANRRETQMGDLHQVWEEDQRKYEDKHKYP